MIQYIEIKSDDEMVSTFELDDSLGPVMPPVPNESSNTVVPNPTPLASWPPCPTPTTKAYFAAGADGVRVVSTRETSTLVQQRADVWEAIKAKRDTISETGGALVGSYWFHTDQKSRTQQLGLKDQGRDVLAAGGVLTDVLQRLGSAVQWKTMSGVFVPMTVQLAFDVVKAVGDLDAHSFTVAEQHHQALDASSDPANYDFSANWPSVYTGPAPAP